MKNAELWKQILHNGYKFIEGADPETDETAPSVNELLRLPIIVDARPIDISMMSPPMSGDHLCRPFDRFWCEGNAFHANFGVKFWWGAEVCFVGDDHDGLMSVRGFVMFSGQSPAFAGLAVIPTGEGYKVVNDSRPEYYVKDGIGRWNFTHIVVSGVCDTLNLLSCSNVQTEIRENDPKQVRIATKRHGTSSTGYRYHVLVVKRPGARPDQPGEEIGTMPRHVCRGHFQHYGPAVIHGHPDGQDRGLLFKKLAGRFFVPPHARGDKKNGVVEKDYEVRATA